MNVLIVEDEPPIAADIEEMTRLYLGDNLRTLNTVYTFQEARSWMDRETIDLLLLDLNLSGRDGFDVLREISGRNFHTIVISAYTDRAIEAFNLGILDFVAKPVDEQRLHLALDRFCGRRRIEGQGVRFLTVFKQGRHCPVAVETIRYFKADGYLVELHKEDGTVDLIEKALNKLEQILPERFMRVHRSFIVDIGLIASYRHLGGTQYEIVLKNGETLPLSRKRVTDLRNRFEVKLIEG